MKRLAILMKLNTYDDVFLWMNHNCYHLLGIGLVKQIDIELMVYLGVRRQYVGGIAKPISLP